MQTLCEILEIQNCTRSIASTLMELLLSEFLLKGWGEEVGGQPSASARIKFASL